MPHNRTLPLLLACVVFAASPTPAQQQQQQVIISNRTVVNLASIVPDNFPTAGVAPGSIVGISALTLVATDKPFKAEAFPLTADLAGLRVKARIEGADIDLLPLYAGFGAVFALLPSSTPANGKGEVEVTYQGKSERIPITVLPVAPGLFARGRLGIGPGLASNVNADDGALSPNSFGNAAKPGQRVVLWGTGFGKVEGAAEDTGEVTADLNNGDVEVWIGMKPAKVLAKRRAGCVDSLGESVVPFRGCAGMDRIEVEVPDNGVQPGCMVSVTARAAGGRVSNTVSIAVAPADGGTATAAACQDPGGLSSDQAARIAAAAAADTPLKVGALSLMRLISGTADTGMAIIDRADARFEAFERGSFSNVARTGPIEASLGSCMAAAVSGGALAGLADPTRGRGLKAGDLSVTAGGATVRLSNESDGVYSRELGTSLVVAGFEIPGSTKPPLAPGETAQVTGSGGADVGAFTARVKTIKGVEFAPPSDPLAATLGSETINRANDYTVKWTNGSDDQLITVQLSGSMGEDGGVGYITCSARGGKGELTIPSFLLQLLPGGGGMDIPGLGTIGGKPGALALITTPAADNPGTFDATGLDLGYAFFRAMSARSVSIN